MLRRKESLILSTEFISEYEYMKHHILNCGLNKTNKKKKTKTKTNSVKANIYAQGSVIPLFMYQKISFSCDLNILFAGCSKQCVECVSSSSSKSKDSEMN